MAFNVPYIEAKINLDRFDKEVFESNDFYVTTLAHSLVVAFQHFVDYADAETRQFDIENKREWLKFLQVYHNKYHASRNLLLDVLQGAKLDQEDYEFVKETLLWLFTILLNIFDDSEEEIPHILQALFAGKFYNSFFYHTRVIEVACQHSLGLNEQVALTKKVLATVVEERDYIKQIEAQVLQNVQEPAKLPDDIREHLIVMWLRTCELVQEDITKEKITLLSKFESYAN